MFVVCKKAAHLSLVHCDSQPVKTEIRACPKDRGCFGHAPRPGLSPTPSPHRHPSVEGVHGVGRHPGQPSWGTDKAWHPPVLGSHQVAPTAPLAQLRGPSALPAAATLASSGRSLLGRSWQVGGHVAWVASSGAMGQGKASGDKKSRHTPPARPAWGGTSSLTGSPAAGWGLPTSRTSHKV